MHDFSSYRRAFPALALSSSGSGISSQPDWLKHSLHIFLVYETNDQTKGLKFFNFPFIYSLVGTPTIALDFLDLGACSNVSIARLKNISKILALRSYLTPLKANNHQ
ncbi:hypothetical protein SAMN05660226_04098 [Parapedobacter luteus]|uniref:Uncharacterized protein n=1 Tax=Parapedobacter luteus TaxID=623280 RepID=A0A1T5FN57_9SPHI|nr:hypothetical protein SAMN05660226_04098 [Parapedobacter luteus]